MLLFLFEISAICDRYGVISENDFFILAFPSLSAGICVYSGKNAGLVSEYASVFRKYLFEYTGLTQKLHLIIHYEIGIVKIRRRFYMVI